MHCSHCEIVRRGQHAIHCSSVRKSKNRVSKVWKGIRLNLLHQIPFTVALSLFINATSWTHCWMFLYRLLSCMILWQHFGCTWICIKQECIHVLWTKCVCVCKKKYMVLQENVQLFLKFCKCIWFWLNLENISSE
jgi:hypothetical protein